MVGAEIIAAYVKETEWGTAVTPATDMLVLTGNGLTTNEKPDMVDVMANSHYPAVRSREIVKKANELSFMQNLYPTNVQKLIEMAVKRTSNILDSYTLYKKVGELECVAYAGCKCNRLNLTWDAAGLVEAAFDLIAKSADPEASLTPVAYPTGLPYKGARVAATVNGVAALGIRKGALTVENGLNAGPPGDDLTIQDLDEGFQIWSGTLTAKFSSTAWNALMRTITNHDMTPFIVAITFANNTAAAAKNLVLSFPTCKAVGAPIEGDQGTTVTQTLEIATEAALPTITYPA